MVYKITFLLVEKLIYFLSFQESIQQPFHSITTSDIHPQRVDPYSHIVSKLEFSESGRILFIFTAPIIKELNLIYIFLKRNAFSGYIIIKKIFGYESFVIFSFATQ